LEAFSIKNDLWDYENFEIYLTEGHHNRMNKYSFQLVNFRSVEVFKTSKPKHFPNLKTSKR